MMQFILFVIILVLIVIYVLNSKDRNSILKKIGFVVLGLVLLYILIILIQPKESIVFTHSTISSQSN